MPKHPVKLCFVLVFFTAIFSHAFAQNTLPISTDLKLTLAEAILENTNTAAPSAEQLATLTYAPSADVSAQVLETIFKLSQQDEAKRQALEQEFSRVGMERFVATVFANEGLVTTNVADVVSMYIVYAYVVFNELSGTPPAQDLAVRAQVVAALTRQGSAFPLLDDAAKQQIAEGLLINTMMLAFDHSAVKQGQATNISAEDVKDTAASHLSYALGVEPQAIQLNETGIVINGAMVAQQPPTQPTPTQPIISERVPALGKLEAVQQGTYQCYFSYGGVYGDNPFQKDISFQLFSNNEYFSGNSSIDQGPYSFDPSTGSFKFLDGTMEIEHGYSQGYQENFYGMGPNGKPMLLMLTNEAMDDEQPYYSVYQCQWSGDVTAQPPSVTAQQEAEAARFKWVTPPGQGVRMADIEAVVNYTESVYEVTGLQLNEHVYLLLKNGQFYNNLRVPPADLDVAASQQNEPEAWSQWKREGNNILVENKETGIWEPLQGEVVTPGQSGELLDANLEHMTSYSSGGFGASVFTDTIKLSANGQFEKANYSLAGTGVMQGTLGFNASAASEQDKEGSSSSAGASGDGFAIATSDESSEGGENFFGTYSIDGYTIEFRYDSGQIERLLFFYPFADKSWVFIGNAAFEKQ